jgi:heat shock protein HtpX
MELAWRGSRPIRRAIFGVGVFNARAGAELCYESWGGRCAIRSSGGSVAFTLIPAVPDAQRMRFAGTVVDLPTDRPGIALRCRIHASSRTSWRQRRDTHRVFNHQSSAWAIAGLVMLLAVCGWIVEGAEGARRAVTTGNLRSRSRVISRETLYRWFGARPLSAAEMPGLFSILADVCWRAGLPRLPELYHIAARGDMNAYALGGPEAAAIVLTDGLLRGMTPAEITGILAHEVAHISNNDAWAMDWVAELRCAIERTSLSGLALMRARNRGFAPSHPLEALLYAAPALGHLLSLALCRIRELDADVTALELTGDLHGLVAALDKLERHHSGAPVIPALIRQDGSHLLRSHPATMERVGTLLSLVH